MDVRADKVMSLSEAVKAYVKDGSHISIGGFTVNRNPMAAVYEMIRQGIKNLHVYAHSNGTGVDELVGGGCVGKIEIAYGGNGRAAPTCIRFKQAIQKGTIVHEDYSNYQMSLRFHAGAMGRSLPADPVVPRDGHRQQMGFLEGTAGEGPEDRQPETRRHGQPLRRLGGLQEGRAGAGHQSRRDDHPRSEGRPAGDLPDHGAYLCRCGSGEGGKKRHRHLRGTRRIGGAETRARAQPDPLHSCLGRCAGPLRGIPLIVLPATTTTIRPSFPISPRRPRMTGSSRPISTNSFTA